MEKRGGREGREGFVYGIGGIILFPQAKLIRWGSQDREVGGEGAKAPTSTGAKPKRHIENTTAMANTNSFPNPLILWTPRGKTDNPCELPM